MTNEIIINGAYFNSLQDVWALVGMPPTYYEAHNQPNHLDIARSTDASLVFTEVEKMDPALLDMISEERNGQRVLRDTIAFDDGSEVHTGGVTAHFRFSAPRPMA